MFAFEQGTEAHGLANAASPLLGRFRAVPNAQRQRAAPRGNKNSVLGSWAGRGYAGVVFGAASDDGEERGDEGPLVVRRWWETVRDLWIDPKQVTVGSVVDVWWSRLAVLVILPSILVSHSPWKSTSLRWQTNSCVGRLMVCDTIPKISSARRRR